MMYYKNRIRNLLKGTGFSECQYWGKLRIAGSKEYRFVDVEFWDPKYKDWNVSREYIRGPLKRNMKKIERLFYINRVRFGVSIRL